MWCGSQRCRPTLPVIILMLFFVRGHVGPCVRCSRCRLTCHAILLADIGCLSISRNIFKSLRSETPSYLTDDCKLIADFGRHRLRSADTNALTVPRTYTRLGDRSFSVAGPKVWNSLPTTLQKSNICADQTTFKIIFVWRDCGTLVTF